MGNYYFLISAFPPLKMGANPELSFREVWDLCSLNLNGADLRKAEELLRPLDLYNLRAFWLDLPLDERGLLKGKDLEEALLVKDTLPPFLSDYLERYESIEERLRYFSSLYASLYRDLESRLTGFLQKYYRFERELRLMLTGLRAKQQGRDIVRELQFEDPYDPLAAHLLAQKDAPDYIPPEEFQDLKTLFVENQSEPQNLNRALLEYRFGRIEEMEEPQDFSIDRVLAYIARLMIVESWAELDPKKGMEQLSQYE